MPVASFTVAGFADATGRYLPLACTLNAAPVFTTVAELLGRDLDAHAELVGMTLTNTTAANLARAAIEGVLCGLADGLDALVANGVEIRRILLLGGAARSPAVQQVAATVFDADVVVPEPDEHVALGAAAQAARALGGGTDPGWEPVPATPCPGTTVPHVRDRYREAAGRLAREFG